MTTGTRNLDIDALTLKQGAHSNLNDGACIMEARRRSDGQYAKGTPLTVRLFGRTHRSESGCLEFTGGHDDKGYGTIRDETGRTRKTHKLAWELANGPVPAGLCVCHRCDNPPCIEVSHLFLGTVAENNQDRHAKGRSASLAQAGEEHFAAKLTEADIRMIRQLSNDGMVARLIAQRVGVSRGHIAGILTGRTWTHVA